MSSPAFEAFLARLYTDGETRQRFLAEPRAVARAAGLDEAECEALARIDRKGLELAAESFERKREHAAQNRRPIWGRWLRRL
jgi:hypothetical protein